MLYNALCMFYIYFSFTFIIEYNSVLFPKSRLSDFPQLHSSDRAITFYFFLQIFRFTEQFEPGKIGSHIQIIYITEYLGRLKLIFHLLQFLSVNQFLLQAIEFVAHCRFRQFEANSRRRFSGNVKQACIHTT